MAADLAAKLGVKAIKLAVDLIWASIDKKALGAITKKQSKELAKKVLQHMKVGWLYNENFFEVAFKAADADGDGALDVEEAVTFV